MAWIIGILKFIFTAIGVFSTYLFVLGCISSVVNPQITIQDGKPTEKYTNARYMIALISSIAWALVIALP